jgi:hypothetical protein
MIYKNQNQDPPVTGGIDLGELTVNLGRIADALEKHATSDERFMARIEANAERDERWRTENEARRDRENEQRRADHREIIGRHEAGAKRQKEIDTEWKQELACVHKRTTNLAERVNELFLWAGELQKVQDGDND